MHDALTLLIDGVKVRPSSLKNLPKPVFLSGGTHSTRWTHDVGDATNLEQVVAADQPLSDNEKADILANPDRRIVQHNYWTERNSDLLIQDRPTAAAIPFANNEDLLTAGTPDPKSSVEKYLKILGIAGVYQSVFDCMKAGKGACRSAFADQASLCSAAGDQTLFKLSKDGNRREVVAAAFDYQDRSDASARLKYIEIDGGGHYTQGRANVCRGGGSTHDVDIGTEYIKFMTGFVSQL